MSSGQCPSCGAPVEFAPGAGKVKVCEHCNTVVLRGEAKLEQLGRVADLVDTQSPLKVGLDGNVAGAPFRVVGRLQKTNGAGLWDEWCLAFDDGRTGWLSESEGDWNLMFPVEGAQLPDIDGLAPLTPFPLRDKRFVVEERNEATVNSAEGQLPDYNVQHRYVDATGPKGVFCSLDYAGKKSKDAEAYVGSKVTLDSLGFDRGALVPTPKKEALTAARCPNCNGPMELKAPDATKRVACPYCGALVDVQHGALKFLELLKKPPYAPRLALGSKGTLDGAEWTVLAFLIRSCKVEGTRYPWEEYLLFNRQRGFMWLMASNGHWTKLTPVGAGETVLNEKSSVFQGETYRHYQTVFATTDYVVGECYWQVQVGDQAKAFEFVAPPKSINVDLSPTEATVTLGTMLSAKEVQDAFKLKTPLPPPVGIASAQVNPFKEQAVANAKWGALWGGMLLLLVSIFTMLGNTTQFLSKTFTIPEGAASGSPEAQVFSEPFQITAKVPLEVEVFAPVDNNWLGVSVDLVNNGTGEVIAVYGEPSYYSGVDDGESWSEGSRTQTKSTDVVEPGEYVLRATPMFDGTRRFDTFAVTVKADDGPGCCPCVIFLLLLLVPGYFLLRSNGFETERWNEAVVQLSPTVSTFPHAKVSSDDDDDDDDD